MTREEAIKFANCLKNNYTIDFNDMADFCEMAIKALEQQPKTEGARGDIPLQQSVPEMPQPSERTEERTETHACESKADKALNLLAEWVIECGFGFDNIPEEYEKYKDDIEEMGYREGLVYIVKKESEAKE